MSITKGEWIAKTTASGFCILAGKAFSAVAERHFDCMPTKAELNELHSDARLIAASPLLLDVVREFIEVCSYIRDAGNDDDPVLVKVIDDGHAAIASVEGK